MTQRIEAFGEVKFVLRAVAVADEFNNMHTIPSAELGTDEASFAPTMGTLRNLSGLSDYLDYVDMLGGVIAGVFLVAMSVVLWNAGLTGGLRRYGEIGLRLAVGEDKTHVYGTLLVESLMIGFVGSVLGTLIGLTADYYLQVYGVDIGWMMKGSTMMLPNVIRAQIQPSTFFIGFFPGMIATFIGTAISGIGIYRRQTASLFKELET